MKRWMTKDEHKGVALILASTAAFCLMSGLVRYASHIDPYKTTLFRFIVGLGILGTAALFGKITLKFVNGPLLLLRGLTGGTAILIFFFSISKLGVGKGTVLIYSFPIFSSIFSSIFLKERIGAIRLAAILVALVPVLNYFLGVIAFGEVMSWRSIVGSATVLGACVVVLLKNNGHGKEE